MCTIEETYIGDASKEEVCCASSADGYKPLKRWSINDVVIGEMACTLALPVKNFGHFGNCVCNHTDTQVGTSAGWALLAPVCILCLLTGLYSCVQKHTLPDSSSKSLLGTAQQAAVLLVHHLHVARSIQYQSVCSHPQESCQSRSVYSCRSDRKRHAVSALSWSWPLLLL